MKNIEQETSTAIMKQLDPQALIITDLEALVKAVAQGRASINFLQANLPALNAMARAQEDTMSVPSVEAFNDLGLTRRKENS